MLVGRRQNGPEIAPRADGIDPEVQEALRVALEHDDAVSSHAVAQQCSGTLEIDEVDPIRVRRLCERGKQSIRIQRRRRIAEPPEIPIGINPRIASGPRSMEDQERKTGNSDDTSAQVVQQWRCHISAHGSC